jgi:hypothetical protein
VHGDECNPLCSSLEHQLDAVIGKTLQFKCIKKMKCQNGVKRSNLICSNVCILLNVAL